MALLELLTYNDAFILNDNEFVLYEGADSLLCCCPIDVCCDCIRIEELRDANEGLGQSLCLTISGAISGTAILAPVAIGGPYCASWSGTANITRTCGGEFLDFAVDFFCDTDGNVNIAYSAGGAGCRLTDPTLVSFQCGSSGGNPDKLIAIFEAETLQILPGGCVWCGQQEIVVFTITEEGCDCGWCEWEFGVSGIWILLESTCTDGCVCGPHPPNDPLTYEEGDVIRVFCLRADCGICSWEWDEDASSWVKVLDTCTGACECVPIDFAGSFDGQVVNVPCGIII